MNLNTVATELAWLERSFPRLTIEETTRNFFGSDATDHFKRRAGMAAEIHRGRLHGLTWKKLCQIHGRSLPGVQRLHREHLQALRTRDILAGIIVPATARANPPITTTYQPEQALGFLVAILASSFAAQRADNSP